MQTIYGIWIKDKNTNDKIRLHALYSSYEAALKRLPLVEEVHKEILKRNVEIEEMVIFD